MAELSDTWISVLNALIEAAVAWRTPAQIAAALGRGEEETIDVLCELDLAGWVEVWDANDGARITLSALGAERLRVRLVEIGPGERPRWAKVGEPEPALPRAKNVCAGERAASLEFIEDPTPSVENAVERAEERCRLVRAHAKLPLRINDLPRPTVLVGLDLTPWPGPPTALDAVCPACGSRTLRSHMYCIYCDRWGLDRLPPGDLFAPLLPRPDRPHSGSDRKRLERLEKEKNRARRKAKHKKRQHDELEAERQRKQQIRAQKEEQDPRPPLSSPALDPPPPPIAPAQPTPPAERPARS
jgi:hypothetical protein